MKKKMQSEQINHPAPILDIGASEQVDETLQMFQFLIENAPIAVQWLGREGNFIYVNKQAYRSLGYTREEMMHLKLWDVDAAFTKERFSARWEEFRKEGSVSSHLESWHRRKDGSLFPVEVSAKHIWFGDIEFHVAFVTDISERRKAEEALRLTQFCVEQASFGIMLTGPDARILYVNEQVCKHLGYSRQELYDKLVYEIDPSFSYERWQQHRQILRERQASTFETIHERKDGTIVPVEITNAHIMFQNQSHAFSFIRDISEREQAREEKAQLEAQLQQAQKMESIGRLAGGIAHDFNNLLVPISGYAELGMMQTPPDNKLYHNFEKILLAAGRATGLVEQILAFSRRQVLELRLINLNEVIFDFHKIIQSLIGEDVELTTFLVPDLYPIQADRARIEQILLNLVVNARDAMPDGGQLIIETQNVFLNEAYVKSHQGVRPGSYVVMSISDTGQGMDADVQAHIFEPFFTTKEKGKGTGLGLSTVFGIVKQHEGNIWVYSEPGQGSTFKVYLPRSEDGEQLANVPAPELISVYGIETILVVEDELMVRRLACETLEAYGYHVIEAANPQEAIERAAADQGVIHLLLTDVIMPVMNGRQLYDVLAAERPDLKVLYMSGYTENVIAKRGILEEGIFLLQKPFTIQDFTQKVRTVLGSGTPV